MNDDRTTIAETGSLPADEAVPIVSERRAAPHIELPEPSPLPPSCVDPRTGRMIPISDEEWAARMDHLMRRLDEIDAEDDTPIEVYEQFMRNIDEERRRQGRPPAFEGYY